MGKLEKYLTAISSRGDAYGRNGGILDLLNWCGKIGVYAVTEEEAKRFLEGYPDALPPRTDIKP